MAESIQSLAWEADPKLAAAALQGNSAPTRAFVQQHCKQLKRKLQRRREAARMAMGRTRSGDLLVTQQQWISWFGEHENKFRARMAAAGARRKAANRRLTAAPDVPSLVARLAPDRPKVKVDRLAPWQQLWWGRTGWFCLQMEHGVHRDVVCDVAHHEDLLRGLEPQAAWAIVSF
jgi:hypothetical protein